MCRCCMLLLYKTEVPRKHSASTPPAKSFIRQSRSSIYQFLTVMSLLTESKEVHSASSAVPIGQNHKYESPPAASAGTRTGLSISAAEPVLQLISPTRHLRIVHMNLFHIFSKSLASHISNAARTLSTAEPQLVVRGFCS